MTTLRESQKQQTRELILAAARQLFEQLGYDQTTIRAVAARAGVGIGTVFGHCPDKASLLVASWLDDLDRVLVEAMAGLDQAAPVIDQFLHIVRAYFVYYAKRPRLFKPLIKEIIFHSGALGAEIQAKAQQFLALLAHKLGQARDRGDLRPGIDCPLAANAFFSYYLLVLMNGMNQPVFDPDELVEELRGYLEQLMAGIGPIGG